MTARGAQRLWSRPSAARPGRGPATFSGITTIIAVAMLVAACGGAAVTPSQSQSQSPSPAPGTASPEVGSASPSATQTVPPAPVLTPAPGQEFAIAMGLAKPASPAASADSVSGAINDFGLDLLRRMDSRGNLCASPTSIALALGMLRPGARGITATEMDEVLHSFGAPGQAPEIQALLKSLLSQTFYDDTNFYSEDPQATPDHTGRTLDQILTLGDQVFSQPGMNLEPAFLDSLSSAYGAGMGLLDFKKDPEAARKVINKWVSDNTNGRIPEILQSGDLTTRTRIALANAIYFKGAWTHAFDPKETKPLPFTTDAGAKVSVPTMAIETILPYSAGSGYRAVDLGFGGQGSLSMLIVVPDNMKSFVTGLTASKFESIVRGEEQYIVTLALPRFSAETRLDLADTLKAMGMTSAFSDTADFSGITKDEHLAIARVIHQANIDVVEEGTTAAAATVVIGKATGGPGPDYPLTTLQVNKPFLYFIRDATSGAILFMGLINDPSLKS